MDAAFDKSRLAEHLQERPPPHGTGDSVRPFAEVGHFCRRHVLMQQDVGHLEATARTKNTKRLGQHRGLIRAEVDSIGNLILHLCGKLRQCS